MSTPHHALLIAHAYPPDGNAGVEQYTARLAAALPSQGWRATVLTGRVRRGAAQNGVRRSRVDGVDVIEVIQNWPYRDLPEAADDPALDRVFDAVLEELAPDLVAIQTLHGLSLGFIDRAADRGLPVVLHLHDGWWVCPAGGQRQHVDGSLCLPVDRRRCGACFDASRHREGPLERWGRAAASRLPGFLPPDALHVGFERLPKAARRGLQVINEVAARRLGAASEPAPEALDPRIEARAARIQEVVTRCALVITPSRFLARSLSEDGLILPPWQLVPSGVPGARRAIEASGGPLRVLFVGTFVSHKGPQVLAGALAAMTEREAASLDVRAVGPAPYPAWRAEVARIGRSRLRIDDAVAPGEVGDLLAWSQVVVVPSIWAENAPLIALEARAAGRPVVASAIGGLPELIADGRDGVLVPPGDEAALGAALLRLASDRAALERLTDSVAAPPTLLEWATTVVSVWRPLLRPVS